MNRHEVKHALNSTLVSVLATTPQSETRREASGFLLEESDTREFGSATARNSHNYPDRSACRKSTVPNREMSSLVGSTRHFHTRLCSVCHVSLTPTWALGSPRAVPMLQGKAPKNNVDTIMHSQVALELHYIIKSVTLPLNETATYCLRWPLLSVRCDNAMCVTPLITSPRGIWAFRLALGFLTSTVTDTPVSMNCPKRLLLVS